MRHRALAPQGELRRLGKISDVLDVYQRLFRMTIGGVTPRSGASLQASIVISTFNRAEALGETLDSLSRQDVPADSYEVIVVDDGSTDETQAVLSAAGVPYRLRTSHHRENRGVSAGRNSGIRMADGRYLSS